MEVLSYQMTGVRVVRLRGRLEGEEDAATVARQVYAEIPDAPREVLLNLSEILGVSAYGIAAVYDLVRKLDRAGAQVALVVPPDMAGDWQSLLGEGRVGFYPSETEALKGLGGLRDRA